MRRSGAVLRPARREARVTAFAVDALALAAALPVFVALGGLTVLLQTGWLAADPSGTEWRWGYVVTGLWFAAPLAYFSAGSGSRQTVGARLLGLRVLDGRAAEGRPRPLGPGRAALRAALLYPSALLLGVGFLAALCDRRGRTLADRLTESGVFEVEEAAQP